VYAATADELEELGKAEKALEGGRRKEMIKTNRDT